MGSSGVDVRWPTDQCRAQQEHSLERPAKYSVNPPLNQGSGGGSRTYLCAGTCDARIQGQLSQSAIGSGQYLRPKRTIVATLGRVVYWSRTGLLSMRGAGRVLGIHDCVDDVDSQTRATNWRLAESVDWAPS